MLTFPGEFDIGIYSFESEYLSIHHFSRSDGAEKKSTHRHKNTTSITTTTKTFYFGQIHARTMFN